MTDGVAKPASHDGAGVPSEMKAWPKTRSRGDAFPIVVHSHLRWAFVWQRPQQTHSRLARRHRVLFVEEPTLQARGLQDRLDITSPIENLWIVQPQLSPGPNVELRTRALLREAGQSIFKDSFANAVHWLYTPMMEPQIDEFSKPRAIVYDCMDELSQFAAPPLHLAERERRLLQRADLVFTGGYELGAAKSKLHSNVHVFGCGVDFDHFHQAATLDDPALDLEMIPRPRLGYIGVIDERLDYQLLRDLARANRSWSIVMVGPVVKVDPEGLPNEPNIVYLGPRDYSDLPSYARGFDACLMPFAMNAASFYINPTKTLEYLATGKPVISTPVRDVVRQFKDSVHIAQAAAFPTMVSRVLAGDRFDSKTGIERARASSWEKNISQMELYVAVAAAGPSGAKTRSRQSSARPAVEPRGARIGVPA